MTNISRRTFIKTGAFAAAGLTIVPGHVLGRSFGFTAPSDKLNIEIGRASCREIVSKSV